MINSKIWMIISPTLFVLEWYKKTDYVPEEMTSFRSLDQGVIFCKDYNTQKVTNSKKKKIRVISTIHFSAEGKGQVKIFKLLKNFFSTF